MHARDRVPLPRGRFELAVWRDDRVVWTLREPNLVLDAMKVVLPVMLVGAGTVIDTIGIGTNGTAPDVGDQALTDPFTRPIVGFDFTGPGEVTLSWEILQGEGNPKAVREFGLITNTGLLVARKVIANVIDKDVPVKLTGAWTIHW